MNYLSVCSGIEAATVAWHPLDWKAVAYSEIEKFPSEVLAHHYPNTPNVGDMTKFKEWNLGTNVDLLVGGTPCQSFSVAGLRKGLDDPRGNLMLTYLAIAKQYRPNWLVWENVPGVLSSNGGRDFGSFLGGLAECGYGFAYRVLDAQYFGVAQRRRRVFVVGYLGDWRPAAAVLFERHSLSGNPAPRRETRKKTTPTIGTGVNVSYDMKQHHNPQNAMAVAFGFDAYNQTIQGEVNQPLRVSSAPGQVDAVGGIVQGMAVRRLTPVECERLQGFGDNYTDIKSKNKPTPDGPRYKALGNSMAVPVMRWIGERIKAYEFQIER